MGEPLAIGALKTIRSNEVGSGLRLNAQIDAEYLGLTDEQALAWEEHTSSASSRCGPTRRRATPRAAATSASSRRSRASPSSCRATSS
jgi:hypothetical protein